MPLVDRRRINNLRVAVCCFHEYNVGSTLVFDIAELTFNCSLNCNPRCLLLHFCNIREVNKEVQYEYKRQFTKEKSNEVQRIKCQNIFINLSKKENTYILKFTMISI